MHSSANIHGAGLVLLFRMQGKARAEVTFCCRPPDAMPLVHAVASHHCTGGSPSTSAIVVATFLTQQETVTSLEQAGIQAGRIAGLVVLGGAELWLWSSDERGYKLDEDYESHIQFR